jgi:serine/threonine protein phosphatase PrpC
MSFDHKANEPSEVKRIRAIGGYVIQGKVAGSLAVSRAFGDAELKDWVISEPFTKDTTLKPGDKALILACDGVRLFTNLLIFESCGMSAQMKKRPRLSLGKQTHKK